MLMETEGTRRRRRLKKTWWDCVRGDMKTFGLYQQDGQDGVNGD